MDPVYPENPRPIGFEMTPRIPPIGFESETDPQQRPPPPGIYIPPDADECVKPSPKTHDSNDRTALNNANGQQSPSTNESYFLASPGVDGSVMRIDYVMVYTQQQMSDFTKRDKREKFEANLEKGGLVLETVENASDKVSFVKVHVPWEVLLSYAELMKVKMPLKGTSIQTPQLGIDTSCLSKCNPFALPEDAYSEEDTYFTCPFRRDRIDMFHIQDKETFFINAERSRICNEILSRTKFGDRENDVGIRRLIGLDVYDSAYPLHEGSYKKKDSGGDIDKEPENDRQLLYELWARPKRFYRYQPLDLIRKYFGEKIGIYFAWLGLYTIFLIPVSFLGLASFIYGLATFMENAPSNDICDQSKVGNYTMCPLCDGACNYWRLNQSCLMSRITYLFDNPFTIAFAIVMSCWGKLFLEFWQRKQGELQYEWDVANYEEHESVRPEFENKCKSVRLNPVTGEQESYLPITQKCPRYTISLVTVVFMVCLVLCSLLGVIVYRIAMITVFYAIENDYVRAYAKIITSCTGALINLVFILILNRLYRIISILLTNMECPRTETEYEDKFTLKMYCFQFFNFYSSLFYIAFFKGNFIGRPGKYNYSFANNRQEECDPAGCLVELCIQMLIIFGGKQVFNNFIELGIPMIQNAIRRRRLKKQAEDPSLVQKKKATTNWRKGGSKAATAAGTKGLGFSWIVLENEKAPQWEKDYGLMDVTKLCLFDEYLEMIIQFGFVTLFVSAMPLAPLFALCNNIIEIRLDAYKMLTQWRRPHADRAEDIGYWFHILRAISVLAVVTNAVIISCTSDAVPKMVYRYRYSNDTLEGYVDFTLSQFSIVDFEAKNIPFDNHSEFMNLETCRYRGFRFPPNSPQRYQYTEAYWNVLTARLGFIICFEHLVFFLTSIIGWLIPNMSDRVRIEMLRERYLTQELMYQAETKNLETHLAEAKHDKQK